MSDLYIGLISGTSVDAIDVALVECSGKQSKLIATHAEAIPSQVANTIHQVIASGKPTLASITQLDNTLGELFAIAVNALLKQQSLDASAITAVGSHGQTVWHEPPSTKQHGATLQIGNAHIIAANTGIDTVADFRRHDMALGGQGAPLAPLFHAALAPNQGSYVFLNLGGIANISHVLDGTVKSGFDTGPANTLMDLWVRTTQQKAFDHAGEWASTGKVNNALLGQFLSDPYFALPAPKSTGRELFNQAWLDEKIQSANQTDNQSDLKPEDIQATLLELSASTIANEILKLSPQPTTIYLCGGGFRNTALIKRLEALLAAKAITLNSTEALGVDPDFVEAALFAWLAKQRVENVPVDTTAITGCKQAHLAGTIFARN